MVDEQELQDAAFEQEDTPTEGGDPDMELRSSQATDTMGKSNAGVR